MIFEESGTTFTAFVLDRRLDAALGMLTSPRHAAWSITRIALEAGFVDLSHFNRRFKQRFRSTPTDVRRRRGDGLAPDAPARAAIATPPVSGLNLPT